MFGKYEYVILLSIPMFFVGLICGMLIALKYINIIQAITIIMMTYSILVKHKFYETKRN